MSVYLGKHVVITGANRGLGLGFVRYLLSDYPEELNQIAAESSKVKVIQLDVTDDQTIEKAAELVGNEVGDEGVDLLINNAGIAIMAFLPLLKKAAAKNGRKTKVLNLSSGLGSREINKGVAANNDFAYAASKAALNMYSHILSVSDYAQHLVVLSMCPGHVKTDLGGPEAQLTIADSIPFVLKTTAKATTEQSGQYTDRHGKIYVA
ncbi:C-factor-like protein [Aphelenchoides besseyi]|nr:C-factor-like protein [Aphelenchoides besseyi]